MGGTLVVGATLLPLGALNVKTFGAKGDGITDDYAAILAAQSAAATAHACVYFPNAIYAFGTPITVTAHGTCWIGDYGSTLKYTGTATSSAITLDGTGASNGIRVDLSSLRLDGKLANYALYASKIVAFNWQNLSVIGATVTGIKCNWCIAGYIGHYVASADMYTWTVTPVNGIEFSGLSSAVTLDTPYIQGVSNAGILLTSGQQLSIHGGSSEGNAYGIYEASASGRNSISDIDLEQNTTADLYQAGSNDTIRGNAFSTAVSSLVLASPAQWNNYYGGSYQSLSILSGASNNSFFGTHFVTTPVDGGANDYFYRSYNDALSMWIPNVTFQWATYIITKTAGSWTINGGNPQVATHTNTQTINFATPVAYALLQSPVKLKTLVQCAGVTALLVYGIGTAGNIYEFAAPLDIYNLKAAVGPSNYLWQPLIAPVAKTYSTTWNVTLDVGAGFADSITDGCSFYIGAASGTIVPTP
jgi:hypothetical protein